MYPKRKQYISERVQSLLVDNGVTAPPVPVKRIAKSLKAQLRYSPLDDELSEWFT